MAEGASVHAACAFSASAATLEGRACTTRSLLTLTMPGGAPRGLLTSLARATITGGLPSLRAFEKYAARLAAKMTSSGLGSLHHKQAPAEPMAAILWGTNIVQEMARTRKRARAGRCGSPGSRERGTTGRRLPRCASAHRSPGGCAPQAPGHTATFKRAQELRHLLCVGQSKHFHVMSVNSPHPQAGRRGELAEGALAGRAAGALNSLARLDGCDLCERSLGRRPHVPAQHQLVLHGAPL